MEGQGHTPDLDLSPAPGLDLDPDPDLGHTPGLDPDPDLDLGLDLGLDHIRAPGRTPDLARGPHRIPHPPRRRLPRPTAGAGTTRCGRAWPWA
ncbi:Uncharacterised protein [Bordetella hinzii]|nr:hypothetical protein ACR54_02465 [Bordetella hinzii]SNV83480.1 Uncharacterised protein [Bordetella hinzii]